MTIRVCLIMIILFNIHNKQIDYTAAFLQAPFDHYVYIEMPMMFTSPCKIWLLKRALYGLKDAPRAYFIHTKDKLEDLGFRQSDADPCLFILPTVTLLCYCDDCLLSYTDEAAVNILTK